MSQIVPKFELGNVYATLGAIAALLESDVDPAVLLKRHAIGDWGSLCQKDRAENEKALIRGSRLFSQYDLPSGSKVWVITEASSSTTPTGCSSGAGRNCGRPLTA